ncbi:hypothetical protein BD309DRAFT_990692 [Dichomitus squalens]|uniref:DUF6533 domain-containing protein n=1 Tax=Dichomitus squalens TaxID=114155 RepID=A0A4Q9N203_9APHY|nr:hypothetical protein BD311DRAFT_651060 [Dichomitus squalens]TBU43813.1 hypothetical protein BD309DRAFT_990692 [Dichomitus squalens]TBU61765.1 hypothetical protein BD310DRAFT_946243 [Dichomitus squalens]
MSSQSAEAAALISVFEVIYQANLCIVASSVFLVYDYVVTFSREVNTFWPARLTGAYALFFVNRYVTLVWNMMGLAQLGKFSDKLLCTDLRQSCPAFYKAFAGISYFQYIIWAAFSGLRAYALGRNKVLAILVFFLATVPAGINYAQFRFGLRGDNDPTFGCGADTNMTPTLARNGDRLTYMSYHNGHYPSYLDMDNSGKKRHHL